MNVARLEIDQLFTQGSRRGQPCTLDTFLVGLILKNLVSVVFNLFACYAGLMILKICSFFLWCQNLSAECYNVLCPFSENPKKWGSKFLALK